ncbi:MAG: hypothetical protein OJF55_000636 [Rhodanobacteraceae bacterium]|nr:MAG: hypothetical protein OJF55_000636 [Rhodanobacteraceae bacterium]
MRIIGRAGIRVNAGKRRVHRGLRSLSGCPRRFTGSRMAGLS